jgi:hypothetical protein
MPNFTFATSPAMVALKHPVDFGTLQNGAGTSIIPIHITHDSVTALQSVGVYLQPYSGTGYVGLYGPSQDYLDILDWGLHISGTRGLNVNMDRAATTAPFDNFLKSGVSATGASATNAIPLSTAMFLAASSTGPGHFPVGNTAHMTLKMSIPPTETDIGLRQASLFLKFDQ